MSKIRYCGVCSLMCRDNRVRRRHVHKKHGPLPDFCNSCQEPFLTESALKQHNKAKHGATVIYDLGRRSVFGMSSLSSSLPSIFNFGNMSSLGASYIPSPSYEVGSGFARKVPVNYSSSSVLDTLTSSREVDSFIATQIQPDADYLDKCNRTVDRIVHLLQNNVPENLRPGEVVKGGSLGKGTAVRGKSDIDLVLMLKNYDSVREMTSNLEKILDSLAHCLEEFPNLEIERKTPYSVQLVADVSSGEQLAIDVLPAVNVLRTGDREDVFRRMGGVDKDIRRYYSPSLSPLQVNLFKTLPTKLKSLIRLVKYWKKQHAANQWPTSYVMEVVTLAAWNEAGSPVDFDIRKGLYGVLKSVSDHKNFSVVLENHMEYTADVLSRLSAPYIMDPCNPYNNLYLMPYQGKAWDWDAVASEARDYLGKPLLRDISHDSLNWR